MLQFNLNVSIVLREYPFPQRFDHAARAGFGAVHLTIAYAKLQALVDGATRTSKRLWGN